MASPVPTACRPGCAGYPDLRRRRDCRCSADRRSSAAGRHLESRTRDRRPSSGDSSREMVVGPHSDEMTRRRSRGSRPRRGWTRHTVAGRRPVPHPGPGNRGGDRRSIKQRRGPVMTVCARRHHDRITVDKRCSSTPIGHAHRVPRRCLSLPEVACRRRPPIGLSRWTPVAPGATARRSRSDDHVSRYRPVKVGDKMTAVHLSRRENFARWKISFRPLADQP